MVKLCRKGNTACRRSPSLWSPVIVIVGVTHRICTIHAIRDAADAVVVVAGVVVILVGVIDDRAGAIRSHLHRDRLLAVRVVAHRQLQAVAVIQLLDRPEGLEREGIDDVRRIVRVGPNQIGANASERADGVIRVIDRLAKMIMRYQKAFWPTSATYQRSDLGL